MVRIFFHPYFDNNLVAIDWYVPQDNDRADSQGNVQRGQTADIPLNRTRERHRLCDCMGVLPSLARSQRKACSKT
jgi:hypothetical protein